MFAQIAPSAPVSASRSGMVQRAWEHFRSLGSPRYLCAPMVDASELAFRILVRRYGVQLAYTPMLHSSNFLRCEKYREEYFSTCSIDRPLVAQFCGNEPETLVAAAKHVENIARRGRYGAFLQDDWTLVQRLVSSLDAACRVPVWCKIRVFPDESRTLAYAQLLENAGCAVLAVHGRTRDQKGNEPGPANWSIIKQIKEHLRIPVLLNGNIQSWADVQRGLAETHCDGILSADRLLAYPALFSGREDLCIYQLAHEYLDIVETYDPRTHPRIIRGHLFRMLTSDIRRDETIRNGLLQAHTVAAFTDVLKMAERRAANISRMESAPAGTERRGWQPHVFFDTIGHGSHFDNEMEN
ncbi:tRNA-dihydrouridine(16/17) synthase [NAD(P)(+)]-like protein [Cyanidiococcus yangmingshanensis]|uniref:tRNA-dihydrouridine(16/17) synthase [NAD(P)(+)]-like protein n=1 Tax=Cyanidiococcus yangmingshanensis TaxID=2690220 RepID=A0A7J7IMP9_9RHOD|nr:tRNA-dihydrouridine(16/17) synthase [NAD(P)(+)]-like protein [Cyanidiococcus yangmingshanensis]